MLRITADDGGGTLSVAGDLVGEWAVLLEQECARRLDAQSEIRVDLADLRRVDEAGLDALRRLRRRGVRIVRCSGVVSELVDGCEPGGS